MRLESIDFNKLEAITKQNAWGSGNPYRERLHYRDERYWYKLWDPKYIQSLPVAIGETYFRRSFRNNSLHGFDVGLFDATNTPAFVDFIYDNRENLRGYIVGVGHPPSTIDPTFILNFACRCISAGWVYSDFCFNNIIECDGKLSIIDFDSHLSSLEKLSIKFERERGSLRPHVFELFRNKIESYLENKVEFKESMCDLNGGNDNYRNKLGPFTIYKED